MCRSQKQLRRVRCSAGILVPLVVLCSIFRLDFYLPRPDISFIRLTSIHSVLSRHTKKVTGISSILQISGQNVVECLVDMQINFDCSCSTRPSLPCERCYQRDVKVGHLETPTDAASVAHLPTILVEQSSWNWLACAVNEQVFSLETGETCVVTWGPSGQSLVFYGHFFFVW